jgi:serine/threonine-protein kinase RsbW
LKRSRQLTRAAELESLAQFRAFVDDVCAQHPGIDQAVCYDLKLAVDEACTNIISHGYEGMNPGSIILSLRLEPRRVVVQITDFGHPFEPYEPERPDIAASLEDGSSLGRETAGGFGLFFIYQTMDEIGYWTAEDGNHLEFIKWFPAAQAR